MNGGFCGLISGCSGRGTMPSTSTMWLFPGAEKSALLRWEVADPYPRQDKQNNKGDRRLSPKHPPRRKIPCHPCTFVH